MFWVKAHNSTTLSVNTLAHPNIYLYHPTAFKNTFDWSIPAKKGSKLLHIDI